MGDKEAEDVERKPFKHQQSTTSFLARDRKERQVSLEAPVFCRGLAARSGKTQLQQKRHEETRAGNTVLTDRSNHLGGGSVYSSLKLKGPSESRKEVGVRMSGILTSRHHMTHSYSYMERKNVV